MKSILISIRPQWVAKILNGEKTIEIRKKFPKDYVGWVYIYCTKGGKQLVDCPQWVENELYHQLWYDKDIALLENSQMLLNGKVVARFWCDKTEEIYANPIGTWEYHNMHIKACLTNQQLCNYLGYKVGYAIHITKLEIFDKPKELKSFFVHSHNVSGIGFRGEEKQFDILKPLNRAPQSWCYVEI